MSSAFSHKEHKEHKAGWKTVRLGDVAESVSQTYRGSHSKVVLINTSDVFSGRILNHSTVDNKNLKGQFKKTFRQGDILYSEIRPANCRYARVTETNTDNYIASTKLMVIRRRSDMIDNNFLFLQLTSPEFVAELQYLAELRSGTFPQITFDGEIASKEIALPPLETQKKIAAVLGALDDKIELNRKMNANLEAQAQALFKSWFVDFTPFGGKMPKDWKKGRFTDLICDMFNGDWGKDEPEKNNQAPVYCIRGADIPNVRMGEIGKMPLRYILPKNLGKKKLVDHDLVVEIAGGSPTQSTGRVAIVRNMLLSKYPHDLICTNFCKAVRPRINFGIYLYLAWTDAYNLKHYFQYENGTTGIKNLDISALIDNEEIVVPDDKTAERFNAVVGKYFDLIYCNSNESRKLAELRDTLLPKLMKGEIIV